MEWTTDMEVEHRIQWIRKELLGRCLSKKSELRHIAEGAGFDFVPVEILTAGDNEARVILRPKGLGDIHVQAVHPAAGSRSSSFT
jgi:hypothetical protein